MKAGGACEMGRMGEFLFQLLCIISLLCSVSSEKGLNTQYDERKQAEKGVLATGVTLIADKLYDAYSYTYGAILHGMGMSNTCTFIDNMSETLQAHLQHVIRGQQEGIDIITKAIASWEMKRKISEIESIQERSGSGHAKPLVLAITGSTGIGKSETAFQLASSILANKKQSESGTGRNTGSNKRSLPTGLLQFRGEDFAPSTGLALHEVHTRIRRELLRHYEECRAGYRGDYVDKNKGSIVIFDEVQKAMPGTLAVFMPLLRERGMLTSTEDDVGTRGSPHPSTSNPTNSSNPLQTTDTLSFQYDMSNSIFLFISDIGQDKMIKLLLRFGSRQSIPLPILRNEVKAAMDEQWAGHGLQFGKMIDEVVPFLPMEQNHIELVLDVKLQQLGNASSSLNTAVSNQHWWQRLVVDRDVISYISGPAYLKYVSYVGKAKGPSGSKPPTPTSTMSTDAQPEDSATLQLSIDGTALGLSGSRASNTASAEMLPIPTQPTQIIVAKYGARALENGGPLQDLRAIL